MMHYTIFKGIEFLWMFPLVIGLNLIDSVWFIHPLDWAKYWHLGYICVLAQREFIFILNHLLRSDPEDKGAMVLNQIVMWSYRGKKLFFFPFFSLKKIVDFKRSLSALKEQFWIQSFIVATHLLLHIKHTLLGLKRTGLQSEANVCMCAQICRQHKALPCLSDEWERKLSQWVNTNRNVCYHWHLNVGGDQEGVSAQTNHINEDSF